SLPTWLDALILQMLAKDPAKRPQTMEAVVGALGQPPGRGRTAIHPTRPPEVPTLKKTPSTFNQLTGEVATGAARRPRRRRAWGVARGVVGAALGAAVVSSSREQSQPPAAALVTPPPAPPPARVVTVPVPAPAPVAARPPAPAPAPAPVAVSLAVAPIPIAPA